jgi:Second Messenger Oligonucleotide or Dinucleotide Synthetase domain
MPTTIRTAFNEFATRLEPTDTQRADASAKHTGVRDCLNSSLWVSSAFITGSYGRHTIIRPPNDIDLFVVLDYSKHGGDYYTAYGGLDKALDRFHYLLKGCYPYTPIRKDHPAIYLNFSTYGFDVIPAFVRNGGGYMIPNRDGSSWMSTDPTKHAETTTNMNKQTDGYFVPLVKMFKSWNRSHYDKLTGFHLEMAMANAWPTAISCVYPYNSEPVKYTSFAKAAAALFPALSSKLQYRTSDPAGMSGNIDDYLGYEDRQLTRERLDSAATAAQIALRHEDREDHYSGINKWRDIFGDPFPAYSY